MKRYLLILLTAMMCVSATGAKKKTTKTTRSSEKVRQEQRDTRRRIQNTQSKVDQNSRQTREGLDKLNAIEADIAVRQEAINRMAARISELNGQIATLSDSVAANEADISRLKDEYGESLRAMRRQRQTLNSVNYVFASETFDQAQRRLRYLRQIGDWHKSKARSLKEAVARLQLRRQQLEAKRNELADQQASMEVAARQLDSKRAEASTVLADLRRQGRSLNTELRRQKHHLDELNAELDRAIAEEVRRAEAERKRRQKEEEARRRKEEETRRARQQQQQQQSGDTRQQKPDDKPQTTAPQPQKPQGESGYAAEERRLTGSFESNKGKLLFPVAGKYTIVTPYGTQRRPGTGVAIRNNGIDISTSPAAQVRAIFAGEIVSVFKVKGTGYYAILVRHGRYISVYSKLASYSVSNGQKVTAGQTLGTVFHDPEQNDNRLHFELRRESQTLNPLEWVK